MFSIDPTYGGCLMTCPRCGWHLSQKYITEPPMCMACGFENYNYPLPKRNRNRNRLMGGLSSQLRYIGFANALQDATIAVRVERNDLLSMGIMIIPACPWDDTDMGVVPKSGFGKNKYRRTYKCSKRHKISLLSSTNGELRGWM